MSAKKKGSSRVAHSERPQVRGPAHIVLRIRRGLPGMRTPRVWRVLERAFRRAKERNGMRIVEFSIQEDHIHVLVEVGDKEYLSRGMQGLMIRIAKALNRHWNRAGTVWADRYFARAITSLSDLRRTVRYILQNAFHHGAEIPERYKGQPDPYSSGRWYLYWMGAEDLRRPHRSPPVVRGFIRYFGFCAWIGIDEMPGDPIFAFYD